MMKQKNMDIAELLDRFIQGQTSEAEERQLTDYFCHTDDIPAEWNIYQELFRSFRTDAYDFTTEEVKAMLTPKEMEAKPKSTPQRSISTPRKHAWQIATRVSVAACLLALISTVALRLWHSSDEETSPQVNQEITVGELLETLTILAATTPDDATITATSTADGIQVSMATHEGRSASYLLTRRSDNSTLEMTSQHIHY